MLSFSHQHTIRAIVIHHYYLPQQVFRSAIDNAAQGSFDDGQGLVQVDQHHSETWQVLWVTPFETPSQKQRDLLTKSYVFCDVCV